MTSQTCQPIRHTKAQIAALYRVSVRTIERWLASGLQAKQAKPRARVLISVDDVERFLQPQHVTQDLNAIVEDTLASMAISQRRTS